MDDEPVIISEKDFTPTPSQSPVPEDPPAADASEEKSDEQATDSALDTSAVVSDDEGGDAVLDENQGNDVIEKEADARATELDDDEVKDEAIIKSEVRNSEVSEPDSVIEKEEPVKEELAEDASLLETKEEITSAPSKEEIPAKTEESIIEGEKEESSQPLAPEVPSARQIVSIGTATDSYAFTFHEEELNAILAKIPAGWKVSVVSVVGAFRTGKSFLLSWFLRYLEQHCVKRNSVSETASNDDKKWYERVQTLNQHEGSFDWRGGTERNTTGMWMWSDPYFLSRESGEDVAVLLVDTQGMFDHETTVGLTAAIFGLSTLLSSYQIYNVDKRIQEDNLQQLALFSEYGRMAFEAEEKAAASGSKAVTGKEPFQRIEFLVRDWQNFDTEDESDITSMEKEMSEYLDHVLAERAASDLKATREQINSCFEEVSCFMMTHPGFAVIKNKYEGDVSKIEGLFLSLLDRYCHRVFDTAGRLQPKTVRGRELSAVELGTYIKSYAQMFEEIGAHFPKAETMLEATSKANNANAINASVDAYIEAMNAVAGPDASEYHRPDELKIKHKEASQRALMAFDEMANFGSKKSIQDARSAVELKITKDYELYEKLNEGRNPLLGLETYIIPTIIAAFSYVARWIADFSCSSWSQTCKATSEVFSHLYMVVFFFLLIVASTKAKQVSEMVERIKAALGHKGSKND